MFTTRLPAPVSSQTRSLIPGYDASRASISPPIDSALASTSPSPPVNLRSGEGIRTITAISRLLEPEPSLKLFETGLDVHRLAQRARHRLLRFEPVAGDVRDRQVPPGDRALRDQLFQDRDRHAAGGLGEDPFGLREEVDPRDDLVVGHHLDDAAGLARRFEGVEAVGGIADRERLGQRLGFHRLDEVPPFRERRGDRGAARGLRAVDLGLDAGDQPYALELFETLPA